jgi:hypothetical protein
MSEPTNGGERLGRLYQSVEETRDDVREVKEILLEKLFPRVEALERRQARLAGAIGVLLGLWLSLQAVILAWWRPHGG